MNLRMLLEVGSYADDGGFVSPVARFCHQKTEEVVQEF